MNGLDEARCRGKWDLFDSIHPTDHLEAAAICKDCPALIACRQNVTTILNETASVAHYGVVGTWAGELYGRVGHRRPVREPR